MQNLLQGGDSKGQKPIRVLVLLPTRELAIQVSDCFEKYQKYTRLTSACVFGGVSDLPQKRALSRGVDTLIATPGRLLDLINQRVVSLKKLEYFVLDEADRMLDMGFIHDIKKVVAQLPQKRQNLFFSATMPPEITKLAASILRTDPVRVEVAPQSTPIERIRQELYRIDKRRKGALLKEMLLEHPEMKKVLVGTSLEKSDVQLLSYSEDGELTVAYDIIGGPSDSAAEKKVLEYLRGLGLSIDGYGEELDIPASEGFRVYTTSEEKSLEDLCRKNSLKV